jgi:TetR/AcrR family transcriptional repressor of nem operon
MPRVSRAQSALNHGAIQRVSSQLIREQGLRVSVADVMGAAGLTHGGFYGHFKSKDELLGSACAAAFAESVQRWQQRIGSAKDRPAALAALIEGYLTGDGRGLTAAGCPLATLAADISREAADKPVRKVFRRGLEQLLEMLTQLQPEADGEDARQQAVLQLCTLVGAMTLARASAGTALAAELLQTTRRWLAPVTHSAAPARRRRGSRVAAN